MSDIVPSRAIRIVPLVAFPALLKTFGIDPCVFFTIRGIDPCLFDDPDNTVAYADIANSISAAAQETNCEHFGLLLGQSTNERSLGELSEHALRQASVGAALEVFARHFQTHDRGAHLDVAVAEDVTLRYVIIDSGVHSGAQASDTAIAICVQVMRGMCGPLWVPDCVKLARRPPADAKPFRDFFRCRLEYNAAAASLRFSRFWLDAEILSQPARVANDAAARRELAVSNDFAEHLRLLAHERIMQRQDISLKSIALALGVDRKTVHRRLARSDLTYRDLIEQERFSLTRRLLLDTDMPLRQIAPLLGYAELSVLTRAFTGWAGVSPSEWRKTARASRPDALVGLSVGRNLKA